MTKFLPSACLHATSADKEGAPAIAAAVSPATTSAGATVVERPPVAPMLPDVATAEPGTMAASKAVSALVIACYLAFGAAAFWPLFPRMTHNLYGVDGDYGQSVWFIAWIPHALAHGLNPFFSNSLFVPSGVNLAQNTASPLLALLTAPLAPLMGAVTRTNLLMVLAMPVSATAAYVVLRSWRVWLPAAATGGLMYGFSPYMVGQALGHVEMIFLPLPPFIAATLVSIVRGKGSSVRLGWQLGLLIAAQYLISPEVLTTTLLAAACLVGAALLRPGEISATFRRTTVAALWASLVAGLLLAYPIWFFLAGPQHFTGRTWPANNPFHNDLLNFVVPGPLQRTSFGLDAAGLRLAAGGDATEAGGYVGVPVLLIAGCLAWRARRSIRMRLAVLVALVAAMLSLGAFLVVDGHRTGFPLPFWVFSHVPLLDDVLPARINLEVGAGLAAVMAFGLDDLRGPRRLHSAPSRPVVVVAAILAVLVVTQLPRWPISSSHRTAQPAIALPRAITDAVPAGDPVAITYPYAGIRPMVWQANAGFRFRLLGGYAYRPGAHGAPTLWPSAMSPPQLQQFLGHEEQSSGYRNLEPIDATLVDAAREAIDRYNIRTVIVDGEVPGSAQVAALFTEVLGSPSAIADHFSIWITPRFSLRAVRMIDQSFAVAARV